MPGELWRTHGLEVSRDADGAIVTSGAMSYWADEPVSSYAVGDTFRPVGAQGPALKVTRVSISDEVIGTRMGKPVRQWHIEVESDGTVTGGGDETTRARWTFEKSKDDVGLTHMSGSVELIIDGDDPSPFSMELGDTFGSKLTDVPIEDMKSLKCTRVSASGDGGLAVRVADGHRLRAGGMVRDRGGRGAADPPRDGEAQEMSPRAKRGLSLWRASRATGTSSASATPRGRSLRPTRGQRR